MKHGDAAQHLHIEMSHLDRSTGRFPYEGIGFWKKSFEFLAGSSAILQGKAAFFQLLPAPPR